MATTIKKWGNSLAVRIPHEVAENAGIIEGTKVIIEQKGASVVVRPAGPMKFSLEELVAGITEENKHELIDWGPPRGKEIW